MNKKSLKNFKQTIGQIITEDITELDRINKRPSHKISLAAKYEDKLSEMDLDDLQELAGNLGLIPIDNRDSLIKLIKKEFKKK